jgi:hypothetical protein
VASTVAHLSSRADRLGSSWKRIPNRGKSTVMLLIFHQKGILNGFCF